MSARASWGGINRAGSVNSDNNNGSNNDSLYRQMRERIGRLEFAAFRRLVFIWLGAKGFRQITSLGRSYRRGRRSSGGADFIARTLDWGWVAIQIRHWQTPIQRRAVDELRGFMLRSGIPLGLIVSNQPFQRAAAEAAAKYPGRTIRLYSPNRLIGSMASLGLGVKRGNGRLWLDQAFWRSLDSLQLASEIRPKPATSVRRSTGRVPEEGTTAPKLVRSQAFELALMALLLILFVYLALKALSA